MNAAETLLETIIAKKERELVSLRESLEIIRKDNAPAISIEDLTRIDLARDLEATSEYGQISSRVQDAIQECGAEFGLVEVMTVLHRHAKERKQTPLDRDTVSQTLSRLARTDKLRVKTPGVGRRPAVYLHPLL